LTFNPVVFADAGSYDVVVTDASGNVVSTAAALTISRPNAARHWEMFE
jgi:hypothetical protein